MNALVITHKANGIATLTLNNPDKANVLSLAMMDALDAELQSANADAGTRVIVIAANGRLFCAGHDLSQLLEQKDMAAREALFARCAKMMATIRNGAKPVIAKVQGTAVAAGCQLVAVCDLAFASEKAKFGVNGIDLGLFCATPSVALSRAIPPRQALELALTGDLIPAARAVELGLINAAVPLEGLDELVAKTATKIAAKDADAIALGKKSFWAQQAADVDTAYALAGRAMADNLALTNTRDKISGFIHKA